MKKFIYLITSSGVLALPLFVNAAGGFLGGDGTSTEFADLLTAILDFTNSYLIPLIIGIGFLVFVWGMFQYFIAGGANDESKEKGKSLMIYATLGFVLIIVFWGIVNLLTSTIGTETEIETVPTVTLPG